MGKTLIQDGPRPKHAQLRDRLLEMATELGPDKAIPSERDLMTTYDVSRATVRKAIDGLIMDGLLRRVHGKGTFVQRPRLESRLHLASFSQDMRRRGRTPSTRLLGVDQVEAPTDVAAAFGIEDGDLVWRIERVRLADDQPIALEHSWYPVSAFPDLDRHDMAGSLYELFREHYGLPIDGAEQTLWGESADPATARRLETEPATALLVFKRVSHSGSRVVEYAVSRYRGDRYQLHMSLGAVE